MFYNATIMIGRGNGAKKVSFGSLLRKLFGLDGEIFPKGKGSPKGPSERCTDHPPVAIIPERLKFLMIFNPVELFTDCLKGYRVFLVGGKIVAESLRYGNALFIYDAGSKDWQNEIKKPRGITNCLCRVTHRGNWKRRVLNLFRQSREGGGWL